MKLFMVTLFVGIATAAKLSNNYLPPNSAPGAGGHGGFLQGPNQGKPGGNYLPPTTTFNNAGQPNSFSHGGQQGGFGGQQGRFQPSGFGGGQAGAYSGGQGGAYSGGQGGAYSGGAGGQYSGSGQQIPILRYNNVNNGDGSYHFDYATGNGIQQNEDGQNNNDEQVVQGSYSYTGDDGQTYTVNYKADANGFQPIGDHLPTPPPIPEAILKSLEYNAAHPEENNAGAYNGGSYNGGQGGSYNGGQGGFGGNTGSFGGNTGSFGGAGRTGSFGGRPQQQYLPPQQHQSGGAGGAAGYHY